MVSKVNETLLRAIICGCILSALPQWEGLCTGRRRMMRNLKILCADNDKRVRGQLARLMGHQGYTVTAVADGNLLIPELEKEAYDVVITDNDMSVMSGLEALRQIRRSPFKDLPVIVFTGANVEKAVKALGGIFIPKGGRGLDDLLDALGDLQHRQL